LILDEIVAWNAVMAQRISGTSTLKSCLTRQAFFDCYQPPVLQETSLFQAMSSVSNTSSGRKRRLIRGVALLFLIHTAVDIAAPDLCRGETLGDTGQRSIAVGAPASTDNVGSSVTVAVFQAYSET
jgi:hypothetical protein